MKNLLLIISTTFLFVISSCKNCDQYECPSGSSNIVGAYCNDGTNSNATGQGACSSHGGVRAWKCETCE